MKSFFVHPGDDFQGVNITTKQSDEKHIEIGDSYFDNASSWQRLDVVDSGNTMDVREYKCNDSLAKQATKYLIPQRIYTIHGDNTH